MCRVQDLIDFLACNSLDELVRLQAEHSGAVAQVKELADRMKANEKQIEEFRSRCMFCLLLALPIRSSTQRVSFC